MVVLGAAAWIAPWHAWLGAPTREPVTLVAPPGEPPRAVPDPIPEAKQPQANAVVLEHASARGSTEDRVAHPGTQPQASRQHRGELDLEAVLSSFLGDHPRIDELQEAVAELAVDAAVVSESVREEDGVVEGAIELPRAGLVAEFRIDAQGYHVDLPVTFGSGRAALRMFGFSFDIDAGAVRYGQVAVEHQVDVRSSEVLAGLAESGDVTGWIVSTNLEEGTRAVPVLTRRTGPGEISVGPARAGEVATIRQEWDYDLSAYAKWHALLAAHAAKD